MLRPTVGRIAEGWFPQRSSASALPAPRWLCATINACGSLASSRRRHNVWPLILDMPRFRK